MFVRRRNGVNGLNLLRHPNEIMRDVISNLSEIFINRFYIEIDRTNRNNEKELFSIINICSKSQLTHCGNQ